MNIKVSGINKESYVDGEGIRYVIYTQGCKHFCEGCHNPETHSMDGGYPVNIDDILTEATKNPMISGITLSGGDPLFQPKEILALVKKIKQETDLNIWLYTGYTYEELVSKEDEQLCEILTYIDVLVDGRYVSSLRDLSLKFRGSRNQRILRLENGKIKL